jgi:hypothetical protein
MNPLLAASLQSIGLLLDIVGVLLLFWFGIPTINRTDGAEFIVTEQINESELKKQQRYDTYGKIGIFALIVGFLLQLIPNLMSLKSIIWQ